MSLDRRYTLLVPGLLTAALLAGCASTSPASNAAVDAMRSRLAQAEQDSATRQAAPEPLRTAEQSLAAADSAARQGDDSAAQHQLYLADRALRTAEATTDAAKARTQMAELGQQRDQAVLNSRTRQLDEAQRQLQARQTAEGQVVSLNDLPFETGKATLQPGAAVRLQPLATYLRAHPDQHVIIRGNTDSSGNPASNRELSQRRADAVMAYLIDAGIPAAQMTAQGLGQDFPVASNDTAVGRAENRRVDVVIQSAANPATAQLPSDVPPGPGAQ